MNQYDNLPPEQRRTQRLVDQFNTDERLWESLEIRRRVRRKARPRLSRRNHLALDLLEFARTRPVQDCIADEARP